MLCHGYEGVMSLLCTHLQVKCYPLYNSRTLIGREKGADGQTHAHELSNIKAPYIRQVCCPCKISFCVCF